MNARSIIDQVSDLAKEYVAEAFARTLALGPGGFEGYMQAAIATYKKQLNAAEEGRRMFVRQSGVKPDMDNQDMRDLLGLRTWVQVLKQETERLSCQD
jgi:hypothetical protein